MRKVIPNAKRLADISSLSECPTRRKSFPPLQTIDGTNLSALFYPTTLSLCTKLLIYKIPFTQHVSTENTVWWRFVPKSTRPYGADSQ